MNDDLDRRNFMKLAGLAATGMAIAGPSKSLMAAEAAPAAAVDAWPPGAPQYQLYMIAYAHIDAVWLWPWSEAMSVVLSTFRSMLDRMKHTPGFAFTESSAQFYQWAADNDPEMLAEIRRRVEEGRWELVGGWWVEPDVNMPNGESLARQGLYGQEVMRRLFGRQAKVGFNPDSFGHTGTLPQILKLQEMHDYVFMRPREALKHLPADVFWWVGPDGTRTLTYRIPLDFQIEGLKHGYNHPGPLQDRVHEILKLHEPVKDLMVFYGAGDHGGGATDKNIQSIRKIMSEPGAPHLIYSTPERFFAALRAMKNLDIPVVHGDLQHHAVGCYTAESRIKKDNRTTEMALTAAEKLASLGSLAWGADYPQEEFTAAWKKVLFQQFHDSLAGSALPEHYAQSRHAYGYAREVANHASDLSLERLAWQVPTTDPDSEYLVVFNPHAWETRLAVEYDLNWGPAVPSELTGAKGQSVAHQWVQGTTIIGTRHTLVFQAPLPAFGYHQFRVRKAAAKTAGSPQVHAAKNVMENDHLRVTFSENGTIGLFDKDAGHEVFAGSAAGARAVVINDPSDTWSHEVVSYSDEISAFGNAEIRVLEPGPYRGKVRVSTHYNGSRLDTEWILYAGSRTLEARCEIDWHEHLKMLKFSYPVLVEDPRSTYETAFGHIERATNGDENPGQRWIDLTGKHHGSEYGLAIINDAKYGYSVLKNDMRVSITRGAVYAQHHPYPLKPHGVYIWQDQGIQTLRLWLVPHQGSWQSAEIVRRAEEYTSPVPVIYQGIHPGSKPQSGSFLSVDVPNVVVSALKKAEEGKDLILRCYETDGRATTATLRLSFAQLHWTGSFRPLEIKTLRIPFHGGEITEVNLLEHELPSAR